MKKAEVFESAREYGELFLHFVSEAHIPDELFVMPDHFAVKCANGIDYLETCLELKSEVASDGIGEAYIDDRMLASAELLGTVSIGGFGFSWVEIMQPKPGKVLRKGEGFVEHTEFTFPDFDEVIGVLERRNIGFSTDTDSPGHSTIIVPIGDSKEIKFNDLPLSEVVARERAEGTLQNFGVR